MKTSLLLIILVASSVAWGQNNPPSPPPVDETQLKLDAGPADSAPIEGADLGMWDFVRMILVLGLMVGLIWGFVHVLKRMTQRPVEELDGVKLLATFSLAPSRYLYFVEIGNRVFVLTGAENGVHNLTELDDQVLIDSLRLKASQIKPKGQPFWEMLKNMLGPHKPPMVTPPASQTEEFFRKQRDRLNKL